MMAVAETASSSNKSPSGTTKARRRLSKCFKTSKSGQFHLLNKPIAQWIHAQAAPDLIVDFTVTTDFAAATGGGTNYMKMQSSQDAGSSVNSNGNLTVSAGNNLDATAATLQSSQGAAQLAADNQINLLAANNESSQTSTNSSSSGSAGVSYGIFTGDVSVNASASKGKGSSIAQDTSFTNTDISAGNTAIIKSGGDTNVVGGVVTANTIKADVGGSLKIESLQDKSSYTSSQKSIGASISIPITVSGSAGASVSASKSNVDSNFQSVGQQSGLKAGDGGFQVSVNNNTDFKGGVIASTQRAVDNNKNTFTTGGALTITDIQNTASFKGTAVGVSAGFSGGKPSGSAGVGSTGGNASSTTTAGISGIAGNTAVRTGDAEPGLQRIFDADKVQKEINAHVAITQAFSQQASKTIGDYAQTKTNEAKNLRNDANNATDPERAKALNAQAKTIEDDWGDNGTLRLLAQTVVGGLTGGASGAAGAAAGTLAAPVVADALRSAGVDGALATTITALASTAAGALAGDTAGAAAGFNEVVNNYLNHAQRNQLVNRYANCQYSTGSVSACQKQLIEEYAAKSVDNDKALLMACMNAQSTQCKTAMTESIDYSADRNVDSYGMNANRLRSAQVNFVQAYLLVNGQGANYYADRTARNNFYQAVQDVVTAKGSTVMWPQMAADVTSNFKLGLHDLFAFSAMTNASKAINGAIFGDAFTQFSSNLLFSPPITGMVADRFDRNMVRIEQIAAQPTWAQLQQQGVSPLLLQFGASVISDPRMSDSLLNQSDRIRFGNQIVDEYRSRIPLTQQQITIPKTLP